MAITAEAALQALRAAVLTAHGSAVDVWVGQSDQVRTGLRYVVTPMSDLPRGFPAETGGIGDENLVVERARSARYQVMGYGEATGPGLQRLADLLFAPSSGLARALRTAGCSPIRTSEVRDMAAYYQTGMEPRFSLDVTLEYVLSTTVEPAVGEVAAIEADVIDGPGTWEAEPAVVVPDP